MKLTLPDKNILEVAVGTTPFEVAKSISISLSKKAIGALYNDSLIELDRPMKEDGSFKILTDKDHEAFHILNHSAAHLMAEAVQSLYPNTHFGVGPSIEEGFYYDIDFNAVKISDQDLEKIEQKMLELSKNDEPIVGREVSFEEAKALFKHDPYKLEMIEGLKDESITVYKQGNFLDLCRGGDRKSVV